MNVQRIGENIRNIRELKNFTQDYVASELGISRETYIEIEKGKGNIKLQTVFDLAKFFNVEVQNIFDFDAQIFFKGNNSTNIIHSSNNNNINSNFSEDVVKMLFSSFKIIQDEHALFMEKLQL